jgi:hypothetical protein
MASQDITKEHLSLVVCGHVDAGKFSEKLLHSQDSSPDNAIRIRKVLARKVGRMMMGSTRGFPDLQSTNLSRQIQESEIVDWGSPNRGLSAKNTCRVGKKICGCGDEGFGILEFFKTRHSLCSLLCLDYL